MALKKAPLYGIKDEDMKAMVLEAVKALPASMIRICTNIRIEITPRREIVVRADYGVITPFDVAWREIKKDA